MLRLMCNVWLEIPADRKKQLIILIILMVVSSIFEVVSISLVVPFLGLLLDPLRFTEQAYIRPYLSNFQNLPFIFTLIFCCSILCAGAIRMLVLWLNLKLSFAIGAKLSNNLFNRTLNQTYEEHISRNSSEIINTISVKMGYLMSAISAGMTIVSSSIVMAIISLMLFVASPIYTGLIFFILLISYWIINLSTKKILTINSGNIALNSSRTIKILQESLGSYRDVLLDNSQKILEKEFDSANSSAWRSEGRVRFIAGAPRYLMEIFGMIALVVVAFLLTSSGTRVVDIIPFIGALALAIQRILPAMQGMYSSWASIRGTQDMVRGAINLLQQPILQIDQEKIYYEKVAFIDIVEFRNIFFRYKQDLPYSLQGVSLRIKRGERVGVIGSTGSGKSTFVDLLMGLLMPTDGGIFIDGKLLDRGNLLSWQKNIAHVPQSIYLTDATIEENIAFNIPKHLINHNRVISAARQAQIATFIEQLPNQYETKVGERGVRLSGGQRQRIGIARALYKDVSLIVFDEATSALDEKTESAIIESINSLNSNLTLLIISHRMSTLRICNRFLEVKNSSITEIYR